MFDILRGMARFLLIGFAVLGAALLYLTLLDRFLHKRFPRIGMFLSAPVVALFFMLPVVALIGAYGELLGLRSLEPFVLIVAYVLTVAFLIWSAATKSNDADSSK
jgi:predicted neutral ceramidase superfamily lipid hydrolase